MCSSTACSLRPPPLHWHTAVTYMSHVGPKAANTWPRWHATEGGSRIKTVKIWILQSSSCRGGSAFIASVCSKYYSMASFRMSNHSAPLLHYLTATNFLRMLRQLLITNTTAPCNSITAFVPGWFLFATGRQRGSGLKHWCHCRVLHLYAFVPLMVFSVRSAEQRRAERLWCGLTQAEWTC